MYLQTAQKKCDNWGEPNLYLQKGTGSDMSRWAVETEQQRKLEYQYVNSAKENAVQLSFVQFWTILYIPNYRAVCNSLGADWLGVRKVNKGLSLKPSIGKRAH